MKRIDYATIGETIHFASFPSGLRIIALPKPGFVRKAATLVVPFGANAHNVLLEGRKEVVTFPIGTAHFLEHMLFESADDNVSRRFAMLGAAVNAYTTYNRTAVYFSTTNGLLEALFVLFDMIDRAVFSPAGIAKEKAIINKEIHLYRDDIDQRLYFDLLSLMYQNNPIKNDIAGDEDSLALIDKAVLDLAFKTYYHPQNMLLVISGDIDVNEIIPRIGEHRIFSKSSSFSAPRPINEPETQDVVPLLERRFELMTDLVMMGIKLKPDVTQEAQKQALEEIKMALLLDNIFGKTSDTFRKLQERKVVNNTFDFSFTSDNDFAHAILYTETKRAEATIDSLTKIIGNCRNHQLDVANFEVQKRKIVGNFIQVFDSVSRANAMLAEYYVRKIDVFQLIEDIERLLPSDIEALAARLASGAVSVVKYSRL